MVAKDEFFLVYGEILLYLLIAIVYRRRSVNNLAVCLDIICSAYLTYIVETILILVLLVSTLLILPE